MAIAAKRFDLQDTEFLTPIEDFINSTRAGILNVEQQFYDVLNAGVLTGDLGGWFGAVVQGNGTQFLTNLGFSMTDGVISQIRQETLSTVRSATGSVMGAVNSMVNGASQLAGEVNGASVYVNQQAQNVENFTDRLSGLGGDLSTQFNSLSRTAQNQIANTGNSLSGGKVTNKVGTTTTATTLSGADLTTYNAMVASMSGGTYTPTSYDGTITISSIVAICDYGYTHGVRGMFTALSQRDVPTEDLVSAAVLILYKAGDRGDMIPITEIANSDIGRFVKAKDPNIVSIIFAKFKRPPGSGPEFYSELEYALKKIDPDWTKPPAGTVISANISLSSVNLPKVDSGTDLSAMFSAALNGMSADSGNTQVVIQDTALLQTSSEMPVGSSADMVENVFA